MSGIATRSDDLSLPEDLESARAKLVYLYVAVRGGASADEIARVLDIGKGTILSILQTLCGRGLVERRGERYVPT